MLDEDLRNLDKRFFKYYEWLNENKALLLSPEELEMFEYHWVRFAVSIGLLDEYYGNREILVLELGAPDVSTRLINSYFPKWRIVNYVEDLRKPNWDLESNQFDLILNMEVIEHLTDQYLEKANDLEYCFDYNAKFVYSGVINCLLESNRVLKKKGRMFLSTPNAVSYLNLQKMLLSEPPHQWLNHVREYTLDELTVLFDRTGFKIENLECAEVLCASWDFSNMEKVLELANADKQNRWSNLFFNLHVKNKDVEPQKYTSILREKDLLIKQKELQINDISQKYNALLLEHNGIKDSLAWRFLKRLRFLIKLIFRK